MQKQLLVMESELNRVRMSQAWQTLRFGGKEFARRATTVGTWFSSAALLAAVAKALWKGSPKPVEKKTPLLRRIINGAHLASTVWFAAQARRRAGS